MKYLKRFNESIKSVNNFYFKIESSEYYSMINQAEEFLNREINIINDCFKKYNIKSPFTHFLFKKSFKIKGDKWIDVTKTKDEWFILKISPIKFNDIDNVDDDIYYKCDQIDGLIKFLDNWIPNNFF